MGTRAYKFADLVVWDSHPLALGATPKAVFIDGISQFPGAPALVKPEAFQREPKVPNFDKQMEETLAYDGLPPLVPAKPHAHTVLFTNVREVFLPDNVRASEAFSASEANPGMVLVRDGKVACLGDAKASCIVTALTDDAEMVDLQGGSITPGLTTFGSPLGVAEIDQEPSTNDGVIVRLSCARLTCSLGLKS
jgi:imidazolonepropionase-like amidohydrolase